MTNMKAHGQIARSCETFRPAIVEAKLMTQKHAKDAVYVATLAEELRTIDKKMSAMEESLHLERSADQNEPTAARASEVDGNAQWIRTKCRELDQRLHTLENLENSPDSSSGITPSTPGSNQPYRWRRRSSPFSTQSNIKHTRAL